MRGNLRTGLKQGGTSADRTKITILKIYSTKAYNEQPNSRKKETNPTSDSKQPPQRMKN